ncbi:MAG: hypothetical protein ACOX3S_04210 [Anaerolineae bacterium]|jgi:hypothetical protein
MDAISKAMQRAQEQGYLVSGTGVTWLECEIRWRRHCQARGEPVVVVSQRKRRADISLFLDRIPHVDTDADELYERLSAAQPLSFTAERLSVSRGMMGTQELFQAAAIGSLEIDEALRLAPVLVEAGRELVAAARA